MKTERDFAGLFRLESGTAIVHRPGSCCEAVTGFGRKDILCDGKGAGID